MDKNINVRVVGLPKKQYDKEWLNTLSDRELSDTALAEGDSEIYGMRKEHLEIAKALYKPTPKVEALVLKLCDLLDKPLPNGVTIKSLTFKEGALKVGGLSVKELIRGGQHCGIEVHWYPNFNISNTTDPFCSAFILRYNSLEKLYREVEKVISQMRDA